MYCNNWECPYNRNGNCDSAEGQTKCNDELLKAIAQLKELENSQAKCNCDK